MSPLKVGVSALFDPADTPHARTFLRALTVARNVIPELAHVQWYFLDDGADRTQAGHVAQQFVARGVDVVIGHFSSDAALGAAPFYQQAGIALLTPAATIDCLTRDHRNVFRFCPPDRQLASDLLRWLNRQGWRSLHIEADQSAHGQALAERIALAAREGGLTLTAQREQAHAEIFAGRLRASREHWQQRRADGSQQPLILTDDAASPHLGPAAADDRNTWVIGFGHGQPAPGECPGSQQHQALFADAPQTYFRESLLLLHVLGALASGNGRGSQLLQALNHRTFNTPLGDVSFDRGECRGACNRVWRVGPQGLQPDTL